MSYAQVQASKSDAEAIEWLIRLQEMATESEDPTTARQQIQDDFNRWATRSPANLRSWIETASVFEALKECEQEMMDQLVAYVDESGDIVSLEPAPPIGRAPWWRRLWNFLCRTRSHST
jgi:ferric-dicitrate binding protein FerR (iron transport regulator)